MLRSSIVTPLCTTQRQVTLRRAPDALAWRYHLAVDVVTHRADNGAGWAVDDAVTQLRRWGTNVSYVLPRDRDTWIVGSSSECDLQLQDAANCVSRRHAQLTRDGQGWTIRDLGSTNGIRQDGERRLTFQLSPGIEIQIGEVQLIAESLKLQELRAYLARIIGWADERAADVDRALRVMREAATRRAVLVVYGASDLTPVVRRLHELVIGRAQPFVVAGTSGLDALAHANGGTVCVIDEHRPPDFEALLSALNEPGTNVRLVLCATDRAAASDAVALFERSATIELPALAARRNEIDRLILEYSDDAVVALDAPGRCFRVHELEWLREVELDGLADLQEMTRRVVALRSWGVVGGAQRLGISHVALSRWARRRRIPT